MRTRKWLLLAAVILPAAIAGGMVRQFRREVADRDLHIDIARQFAWSRSGPVEYAREGDGPPVLIAHGAGGGFDQGLLLGEQLFGKGFNLIAPSRFGYLDTPVPADCSIAAQADAHAAVLDELGIERAIIVGASAGAPSAIELALRHPKRCAALILVVPRAYAPDGPPVEAPADSGAIRDLILANADFTFWLAMRFARHMVVRFLGVSPDQEQAASPAERARVGAIMKDILPLSRRADGLRVDGATRIGPRPLATIGVPTLVIGARDDLYNTLPAARYLAEQIPGAQLVALETGGHLLVGQTEVVRERVGRFLAGCGCTPAVVPLRPGPDKSTRPAAARRRAT